MMDTYFDQAVNILAEWDNNSHGIDEYRKLMLYGLNTTDIANPGSNTGTTAANNLNAEYHKLLSKYGFTQQDLDTYYHTQFYSLNNKLPTSGCN